MQGSRSNIQATQIIQKVRFLSNLIEYSRYLKYYLNNRVFGVLGSSSVKTLV